MQKKRGVNKEKEKCCPPLIKLKYETCIAHYVDVCIRNKQKKK